MGGVVGFGVVVTTGLVATAYLPFIPALACPKRVQRKAYCPFFVNLTVSVWRFPGRSDLVFFPPILKSCLIFPLLITVKITVPTGTLFFENAYLNSEAFTVTFVGAAAFALVVPAAPAGRKTPASAPASASVANPVTPATRLT